MRSVVQVQFERERFELTDYWLQSMVVVCRSCLDARTRRERTPKKLPRRQK